MIYKANGMLHNNEQLKWRQRKFYGANTYLNNAPIKKHIQDNFFDNFKDQERKYNFVDYQGINNGHCSGCSHKLLVCLLWELVNEEKR